MNIVIKIVHLTKGDKLCFLTWTRTQGFLGYCATTLTTELLKPGNWLTDTIQLLTRDTDISPSL